jgi:branched-chain amino acid transport system substrate-binding protein
MRSHALAAAALLAAFTANANAQDVIRIGVMNDMSSVYSDYQGPGSVLAAQLAVQDFGGTVLGKKIEVISADHQNKADIGANLARQWLDVGGVNVVVDLPNSAVAFAVADIVREKNAVVLLSGAGSSLLTGARCSPNTVHWTYDTWAYGQGVAKALINGGAKPSSSSPPTTRSDTILRSRQAKRSMPAAAKLSAGSGILLVSAISARSCCKRRRPAPK